jgi:hypothetical protein
MSSQVNDHLDVVKVRISHPLKDAIQELNSTLTTSGPRKSTNTLRRVIRHLHRTGDRGSFFSAAGLGPVQLFDWHYHRRRNEFRFDAVDLYHFASQSISAGHLAGEVRLA